MFRGGRLHYSIRVAWMGVYSIAPGAVICVYRFQDDPYAAHMPGEGDALLIPLGDDAFTVRVAPGVQIRFTRDADGTVTGVDATLDGRTITAPKL